MNTKFNEFFILIFYRFLNIWPKCEVAAAAATRPFKTELVGHWGESNLAAAHQTAAVFEPQRRKKNYIVASTSACSTEPWQTRPRTSKKGGENLTPPIHCPTVSSKNNKTKIVHRTYGKTVMLFILRYDFKFRY